MLLAPLPLTCVRGLNIINHAVTELALLCATDPDPNVRAAALCAADAAPAFLLVQQRPLMLLFSSLGDEHFAIRKRALELIGDLAAENAAVITPLLRRYLIDLLTKIEYSHDYGVEEESCLLLTTLLTKVPLFVAPSSEVILRKLLPNLRSPSTGVATAALSAISAISRSGGNVSRHYDEIIPFVVESLRDQGSSSKRIERREIALQSLSQITRNTGNVIEPLVRFKDLFDVLLDDMVTAERSVAVKRELYRALGVLGAVDPYLFKKAAVPVHQTVPNEEPQDGGAVEGPPCLTSSEDYYPTVVLTSLIKILSDANLATHHKNALPDIIRCLKSLSPSTIVGYLPVIMKTFSSVVRTCDTSFREQMFNFIATVVLLVKQHIRPYLGQIFAHVFACWDGAIVAAVIPLTEVLAATLAADFKRYLPQYLPLLLKEITRYRHQRILSSLIALGSSLEDHLDIVVPALLRVLDDEKSPMNMIAAVFATFGKLVDALDLEAYYSRLLVATVRVLNHERTSQTLFLSVCFLVSHMLQRGVATDHLALVLALVDRLKGLYQPKFVAHERLQELENVANVALYKLPGQVTIPPVMASIPGLEEVVPFTRAPQQRQGLLSALEGCDGIDIKQAAPPPKKLAINTEVLRSALDLSMQRPTKEVWYEWHRQFCAAFLRESPCSAIRTCQALALDYPPLLRALFNSSFMSCYRELPESFRVLIANRLQSALQSPTIPPEVMQSILDLAEFMDREGQTKDRLSIPNLGELASKCKADGKALRYKEREFRPFVPQEKGKLLEDLIELNSNLNQPDAAFGVLRSVQKHYTIAIPETCLEKLGEWKEAYGLYKARLAVRPDIRALLGSFRCLHSLCRWEELGHNVAETWQAALKQLKYTQECEFKDEQCQANPLYRSHVQQQPQQQPQQQTQQLSQQLSQQQTQQMSQQPSQQRNAFNSTKVLTDLTKSELETFLSELAPFGASAMLNLADWEKMKPYVERIRENPKQKTFYQAILSIYEKDYGAAERYFATAREDVDTEFTALISESYDRSYSTFVYLQQIAELEEMTEFWKGARAGARGTALGHDAAAAQEHAGREHLRELWDKRLKGVKRDIDVWANLLKVRPLFFAPQTDMKVWIKFANLCRKNHRVDLTKQVLYRLLNPRKGRLGEAAELGDADYDRTLLNCTAYPKITITYLRTLWQESSEDVGKKYVVLRHLEDFYTEIPKAPENKQTRSKLSLLMGKYLLSISQLTDTFEQNSARILEAIKSSTENSGNSGKCWHTWAMANIAVIDFYELAFEREKEQLKEGQAGEARALQFRREKLSRLSAFHAHAATRAVDAISAFSRAATLTKGIRFQDTLRLLSLLFKYGDEEKVVEAGREAIQSMGLDALVQVIPQVIARIHTQLPGVAGIIKEILSLIGKSHPQTLIFPLLVAMSSYKKKSHLGSLIISELQTHSSVLYADSVMFCDELSAVGCTIEETWAEAIDQASREYFSNKNPDASLRILLPLHAQLEKGPTTLRENAFFKEFDGDLRVAHQWIKKYESKRNEANFSDAWQIYVKVFRKMSKNIKEMASINLGEVSPKLYAARNLQTAVPGTYRIGEPVVRVQSIVPVLPVIASKQKPRKLFIKGDNGHVYKYLLKGHEDLRQDERVMQLLSLVNGLLALNPETARDRLEIGIFDVVPLTTNTGLICWVTDSDTFHQLIQEHRAQIGLHLNFEYLAMKEMCDAFMEKLTVLQKVELLRHAFAISSGTDLEQSLWKKSPNSEVWLERRTVYTRSLAVMSMVGYVLGLGDRHPSNLMMSRNTGLVTHIDFGDCFEVAQHREKYPEKIPFRLTRMLVLAMEVCGVEGTFRLTCQRVLSLLRENKDSFLTVLETFIYDPLINWRLNKESGAEQPSDDGKIPPEMAEMSTFQGITDLPVSLNYRKQVVLTDEDDENEKVNEKALKIVKRVTMKLTGRFDDEKIMEIPTQVDMLIKQATLHENLAQCYGGWCPYW